MTTTKGELRGLLERALTVLLDWQDERWVPSETREQLIEDIEAIIRPEPPASVGRPRQDAR